LLFGNRLEEVMLLK